MASYLLKTKEKVTFMILSVVTALCVPEHYLSSLPLLVLSGRIPALIGASETLGHGGLWGPIQKCERRKTQGMITDPASKQPGEDAYWHPDVTSQLLSFHLFPHPRLHLTLSHNFSSWA